MLSDPISHSTLKMPEPVPGRSRHRRFTPVALLMLVALSAALEVAAQNAPSATLDRAVIERRLGEAPQKNSDREAALKRLFEQSGCAGQSLTEQPVTHERLPNVICTLPGTTRSVIMVGAHFDHVARGTGIIDNWSGAALLPSLLEGLCHQPRKHTFVFVAFTAEEEGLVGSKFFAKNMTPDEVVRTRAMINLDSLALGPTKVWLHHSDTRLATTLNEVARSLNVPVQVVNAEQFGDDDSEPFMERKVPTLMIHSVTAKTWPILHSHADNAKAVKLSDYYDTYRLLAAYLAYLDTTID